MLRVLDGTPSRIAYKQIVTSVYLRSSKSKKINIFKCPSCGYPVVQYVGDLLRIVPGMAQEKVPIVVQCSHRSCKMKYNFIGVVYDD